MKSRRAALRDCFVHGGSVALGVMIFLGRIKSKTGRIAVLHFGDVVLYVRHEFLTVILWAIRLDMPTADMKITRL
jgi:hypothetical protein